MFLLALSILRLLGLLCMVSIMISYELIFSLLAARGSITVHFLALQLPTHSINRLQYPLLIILVLCLTLLEALEFLSNRLKDLKKVAFVKLNM